MPSLLTYDELVFKAAHSADAHSILDHEGAEIGCVVKQVSSSATGRAPTRS